MLETNFPPKERIILAKLGILECHTYPNHLGPKPFDPYLLGMAALFAGFASQEAFQMQVQTDAASMAGNQSWLSSVRALGLLQQAQCG